MKGDSTFNPANIQQRKRNLNKEAFFLTEADTSIEKNKPKAMRQSQIVQKISH